MSLTATDTGSTSPMTAQVQGLWAFYRRYTHTAIHTASTAALAVFGLLVFVDPLFAVLAIASYVLPPVVLYSLDADVGGSPDSEPSSTHRADAGVNPDAGVVSDSHTGDGDSDSDGDDGDSDSDGRDTDTDSDGNDSDSDGDDGDTDSDR